MRAAKDGVVEEQDGDFDAGVCDWEECFEEVEALGYVETVGLADFYYVGAHSLGDSWEMLVVSMLAIHPTDGSAIQRWPVFHFLPSQPPTSRW